MDDLIEALEIFRSYGNPYHPTHCEHDVLTICGIDPAEVTPEDYERLIFFGFFENTYEDCFQSYRFGSA